MSFFQSWCKNFDYLRFDTYLVFLPSSHYYDAGIIFNILLCILCNHFYDLCTIVSTLRGRTNLRVLSTICKVQIEQIAGFVTRQKLLVCLADCKH